MKQKSDSCKWAVPLVLLALVFAGGGCATQTGPMATEYSGSQIDTVTAVERSEYIFVGRILSSQQRSAPQNTFFAEVRCEAKVTEMIRGKLGDVVKLGYMLDGRDVQAPFRVGDLCVFCMFEKSLVEPEKYLVGKILRASPENILAVKRVAASRK